MPHLRILGKQSLFAGDDIRIPMLFGCVFRALQIALSFSLLDKVINGSERLKEDIDVRLPICLEEMDIDRQWAMQHVYELLTGYTASSGVVALIGFAEFLIIFSLSQKGTPANPEPRKYMGMCCSLNLSLTYAVRVGTFLFGLTVASVAYRFCDCVSSVDDGELNDPASGAGRMLNELSSARQACWMYRSAWSLCLLTLFATQFIDVLYGGLYYSTRVCSFIPSGVLVQATTKWELCCRCCFGLLSCLTCFRMGGVETVGSGELQHFASILTDYFESDGILDVTPTDVVAGLYITRLIHFEEEYTVRQRLKDKSTASILNEAHGAVTTTMQDEKNECKEANSKRDVKDYPIISELGQMVEYTEKQFEKVGIKMNGPEKVGIKMNGPEVNEALKPTRAMLTRSRASVLMFKRSELRDEENPNIHAADINQILRPILNNTLSPENKEEKYLIAEGARYIAFATSIYTWSTEDKEPFCHWNAFSRIKRIKRSDQRGRALKVAPICGVSEDDIVYANYKAGIAATPYAVVLDHAWKSVVVTIRGSQSIDDMMSDLTLDQTELGRVGEKYGFHGIGRYSHKGILGCAEWVTDDLLRARPLDKLLRNDDSEYKNYQLRIVGHSLGAAAASLVALFLRSKFPTVRAVVYEAPGCTLSWNLAEESCDWCISFVTGMDVIPRFTIESMADLRDEMLVNIARIKVPKYLVNRNRGIQEQGIDAVRDFLAEALYPANDIPDSKFLETVRAFRHYYKSKMEKRIQDGYVGLYLPGRIIHMLGGWDSEFKERKTDSFFAEAKIEECTSCWANREDFRFVVLSPHFLSDHGTDEVKIKFDALTEAFGVKEPYADVLEEQEVKH